MPAEQDPISYEKYLENKFYENLIRVGEAHEGCGEGLASYANIRFSYDDKDFNLLPTFKNTDSGVEVTCNPETISLWHEVLDEVPELENDRVDDLYFSSVATFVELSFLAFSAKTERQFEGVDGIKLKAVERAASIISKLDSKADIEKLAYELESEHGLLGVLQVAKGLTERDVFDINRMRYALGTAIYALGLSTDARESIKRAFRRNLQAETENYTKTLLEFLDAFNDPNKYAQFESNIDSIKKAAYAQFIIAGTAPMGYENE